MNDVTFKSTGEKYICPECKNENSISEGVAVNDVIECKFCGIEFRATEKTEEGEYTLEILEEEK